MANRSEKEKEIDRQIMRFEKGARRRLRRLAGLSPRLADLIVSFPAAAYVIATDRVAADAAGEAVRRVKAGCALKEVAQPLKLPMWLKRLPPETFTGRLQGLPDGEKFARQIAGRIPDNPVEASAWLNGVCYAGAAADDEFALWVAGQNPALLRQGLVHCASPLRPLALFAWFSLQAEGAARQLLDKPWQPSMRISTAIAGMQLWIDRVAELFRTVKPRRGPGRYSRKVMAGLRMVMLRTGPQLREEGRIMNHCAGTYAHAVATGECLVFSVRNGANRLATLELRRPFSGKGFMIVQLQGPGNTRVCAGIEEFTRQWVQRFTVEPEAALMWGAEDFTMKPTLWRELWAPYVAAKGTAGFEPTISNLERLLAEADMLRQPD